MQAQNYLTRMGFVAILLLDCGCNSRFPSGPARHDFNAPLVGDYELWRSSSQNIVITGHNGSGIIVPKTVVAIAVQGDVITAKQWVKAEAGHSAGDGEFNYWVIQARDARVQGPLTKADYLESCKKLNVEPDAMKSIDFYRAQAQQAAGADLKRD